MKDLGWLSRSHGFLLVDKPSGITSQDVITLMQRMLIARSAPEAGAPPTIRKRDLPRMGHGGTLDPFATGLLVIAIGNGTKLARYLTDSEKAYDAEVTFGSRTTSGDLTNEVSETTETLPTSFDQLRTIAGSFLGQPYIQLPPMYSAKKIEGTPLYELARKGLDVARARVSCTVREFTVRSAVDQSARNGIARAEISVRVTAGTYIRTLAEDFAVRAGSLAHLSTLRRTAAGPFNITDAVPLAELERHDDWSKIGRSFIPFTECLRGKIPSVEITDEESTTIIHGLKSVVDGLTPKLPADSTRAALYHRGELRAVFLRSEEGWDFERVFHPALKS